MVCVCVISSYACLCMVCVCVCVKSSNAYLVKRHNVDMQVQGKAGMLAVNREWVAMCMLAKYMPPQEMEDILHFVE